MEAVWAAAITGFFSLVTSLVAVFKDELKLYVKSKGQPFIIDGGEAPVPIDSNTLAESNSDETRKRPFDTKTELLRLREGDAYLFRIHRTNKGLFELVFMIGWIIAWTAGIFFFAFVFFAALFGDIEVDTGSLVMRIFTIVFLGGWLLGALVGEFRVAKAIKNRLAAVLGRLQITISKNGITVARVLGPLTSKTQYEAAKIDGFGESEGKVFFRYGIQRVELEGMSANEAEWLKQELNNAYKIVNGYARTTSED